MEKTKAYIKACILMAKAIASYEKKYHPYMSVWALVWMVSGICMSIEGRSIAGIVIGTIIAFIPAAIKRLYVVADHLGKWNANGFRMERERTREVFWKYIWEYITGRDG